MSMVVKSLSITEALAWLFAAISFACVIFWGRQLIDRPTVTTWDWIKKNDPPPGTAAFFEASFPVLLVVLGDCSSCTAVSFDPGKVRVPRKSAIVLLLRNSKQKLPAKLAKPSYKTILDGGGSEQRLNAAWTPRWYWYDESGRLADLQSDPKDLEAAL